MRCLRQAASVYAFVEQLPIEKFHGIGEVTAFAQDLSDVGQMLQELEQIALSCEQRLEQHETRGRTLTLKVK
ncbi:DinB/UmuC family translesion DNA polymerase [Nostoc sp.]